MFKWYSQTICFAIGNVCRNKYINDAIIQGYAIILEKFCEDFVLDSFNTAYRDEDSILNQIYHKKIISY